MTGRNHMLFRPTDTLRDISVVLREDQVEWLNGLTACDEEHDSRSETLRRIIDFARDTIETEISLTEDDVLSPDNPLTPFNLPLA